ncbi:MAG: ATP-binding protein [Blautia sp.]|nr:ATP-binding protein [Blautia sp.]
MEDKGIYNEKIYRSIERTVLIILTLYTIAMFFTAQISGWNIYVKEIIVAALAAGWFVYLKAFWDHRRRAVFISCMVWVNFVAFALNTDSFSSMLITMAGVVVLLGIFSIPRIIYLGLWIPAFIFLYHGFVVRSIPLATTHDIVRVFIEFFSIYTVSAVTWLSIRNRQEANEKLLENIVELENAERSKNDFLVNVSHEIRTPINAVCGMSEAILQEDLPLNVRRDIIDIQTAGRNLLSAVSNILDFSELESGKMELAEESYNITSTITDIINMALTMENGKHLELIVDCDANLPSNLVGDEQKLRRIIINLLENAIKFTREGGVILSIKGRKEEYGINLLVSVRDSGIGIERGDLEKIFTSFSQVNSKRNREEGGVGLGLAITQALVRSLGGFIAVDSVPGTGSEFKFTIPQKVLDETPIVSVKNKKNLFAACYINMDKYNYSVVREGYEDCIRHIVEQLGIMFRVCRNLSELKRRAEYEKYSHIFIGWEEYCEDRLYFEKLAEDHTVVLLLDYGQEIMVRGNMLRIYKPFTVLSIAAVFNGQRIVQNDEQHISLHKRFIAPSASVLVVDDNAMNLKVMARLLLPYQIRVSMAGGGMEALDKLDKTTYDCVFLDHMMPEMDGVETLHKIRQKPGTYFQSLPIIAFTANAIGGAREMFLSEGFDDFIAKPIELSVLERMLRRYIPTQKQIIVEEEDTEEESENAVQLGANITSRESGAGVSPQEEQDASSGAADAESRALAQLSRAGIDIEQGISYCGDQEGLREIIGIYHSEGSRRRSQLQQFFGEQDWKNYVITVHALKSNSKGIGAMELSDLALSLEMAGKGNDIEYILQNHEKLMEMHDRLLEELGKNAFVYPDGNPADARNKKQGTADSRQPEEQAGNAIRINDVRSTGKAGNAQTDSQTDSEQSRGQADNSPAGGQDDGVRSERQPEAGTAESTGAQDTDEQILTGLLGQLKEKLSDFESEGLDEILKRLAECRYQGESLAALAEEIQDKTSEFDFLGAAEGLEQWETERSGR